MGRYRLLRGDCLKRMKGLSDNSIDLCLTDPPYGTTACKWDSVILFEPMWEQLKRITKQNAAICLFGSEPFSSTLRMSNIKNYKYDWYWNKKFGGNFVQAKRMPLKSIECISIFGLIKSLPKYYPIMIEREKPIVQGGTKTAAAIPIKNNKKTHSKKIYTHKYPVTELNYPKELGKTVHPTQKPVMLLEYLIKIYTLENETVLDFTMGSGSTGVAALNTNRKFIGIEKEKEYFEISKRRIREAKKASVNK